MSEDEAREYPDLMGIVEEKVKPDRKKKPGSYSRQWWLFGRRNKEGNNAIAPLERVLVVARHQHNWSIAFVSANIVFSEGLVILALPTYSAFCILQSRIHEIWVRFFGSSLEDRLRYTPSDCFETFPFPENWETNPKLEAAGKEYYEYRAELMVRNNQGLTETYNRFHNPEENHPEIIKLRELHTQMDKAVLEAYGWTDIPTECEFLLDYEDEEDDKEKPHPKQKKE